MMHFWQHRFLPSTFFWVLEHTRMFSDIHVCIYVVSKHTFIFLQHLNLHATPPLLFAALEVSHEACFVCFSLCERVYVCAYTCIYMYIHAYIYIYPYVCTHTLTWICSYSPPLENHTGITLIAARVATQVAAHAEAEPTVVIDCMGLDRFFFSSHCFFFQQLPTWVTSQCLKVVSDLM